MNWYKYVIRLLSGIFIFMLVGAIFSHLYSRKAPLDGWGSASFLYLGGILVFLKSAKNDRLRLLLIGLLGFIAEVIGVQTGLLFGPYEYTSVLAPSLFGTPVVMSCAWLILLTYVRQVLRIFQFAFMVEALFIGLGMVLLDLLIDPLASRTFGFWRWREVGSYYGVPFHNFIGWFAVTLVILMIDRAVFRTNWNPNKTAERMGLGIVLMYAISAFAYDFLIAGWIGLVLVIGHILITLPIHQLKKHRESRRIISQVNYH